MVVGMPHMKNFGHVIASKSLEVTMHTAMLVGNKEEISCTPIMQSPPGPSSAFCVILQRMSSYANELRIREREKIALKNVEH